MKRKKRSTHGRSIAALMAAAGLAPTVMAQTAEHPNVVFILADDLGYGDLSCFGSKKVKTPNIDRLSATGTTFTHCYAGSGISSPSRCSLMTGKNTGHTTIRDNMCTAGGIRGIKINPQGDTTYVRRTNLLPSDTTIATVLGAAGYRTCLVNKWHLDGYDPKASPLYRGFDEFYGWLISTVESNSPYYYPYYRFHGDSLINIKENAHDAHVKHNTDISTDDALAFITRNKNNPFFLYLAFDAPHEPYNIDNTSWYDDEEEWNITEKRYASLITHMDAAIGRLLGALDNMGLREKTLVVFASDNGAAVQAPIEEFGCNAGFRGRKGQLYEGGIRVPLIVNQPGRVSAKKLDNLVYFPDMMPTLAALTGAEAHLPQETDGINILPLFDAKPETAEEQTKQRAAQAFTSRDVDTNSRLLYWEFPGKQRAARRGDWKCVTVKAGAPLELYNLKDDPEERVNLADKHPDMVREFDEAMKRSRKPSPFWPIEGDNR